MSTKEEALTGHIVMEQLAAVQKSLVERYDRLNKYWDRVEAWFCKYRIPRPFAVEVGCDESEEVSHYLGLDRIRGKWQLTYETVWEHDPDTLRTELLADQPASRRLQMMQHCESLRNKLLETCQKFLTEADDALSKVSD